MYSVNANIEYQPRGDPYLQICKTSHVHDLMVVTWKYMTRELWVWDSKGPAVQTGQDGTGWHGEQSNKSSAMMSVRGVSMC